MSDRTESGDWTTRQRFVAAFFIVALVLQFVVPISRLTEPRPARFGWHMYSGVLESVRYSVAIGADSLVAIHVRDVVVNARGDLIYRPHLVPHLCRSVAGAEAVHLESATLGTEVVPCD